MFLLLVSLFAIGATAGCPHAGTASNLPLGHRNLGVVVNRKLKVGSAIANGSSKVSFTAGWPTAKTWVSPQSNSRLRQIRPSILLIISPAP